MKLTRRCFPTLSVVEDIMAERIITLIGLIIYSHAAQ
jgi:hypothetical protein